MCTAALWLLLARHGEAELLAASVVLLARVKAHLVGGRRLDMSVKDRDIHQPLEIVSNYLVDFGKKEVLVFGAIDIHTNYSNLP